MKPSRPVVRYYGGKWSLAPWIIGFFPEDHIVYVEPFGGAASVLLRKPRSRVEVYNDLDGDMVNLFRVLQMPGTAHRLKMLLDVTPYASEELKLAYQPSEDPVERARRTLIRGLMGHGSSGASGRQTGLRRPAGADFGAATDWGNWRAQMHRYTERIMAVVIESLPADRVIAQYDDATTLFYVDPPYPMSTRGAGSGMADSVYQHDMKDDGAHRTMAEMLHGIKGMAVVSGYPCDLYDHELFPDWHRVQRRHRAEAQTESTEVVWLNPACSDALARSREQAGFFDEEMIEANIATTDRTVEQQRGDDAA